MANKRDISITFRAKDATKGAISGLQKRLKTLGGSIKDFVFSVRGLVAGGFAAALGQFAAKSAISFEKLNASLRTVTGSAEAAADAMDDIQAYASDTPFSVQELTESFIKLKSRGLDPSIEALNAYGNVALGLGKSIDQFIEAIADAVTGEFERLKDFGIKASKQGEQITFSFRGVKKTVKNDAREIEGYLRRLGEVEFAGGVEAQAKTLGGALSKLSGAVNLLADKLFREAGLLSFITKAVTGLNDLAAAAIGPTTEIGKLNEQIAELKEKRDELKNSDPGLFESEAKLAIEISNVNLEIERLYAQRAELLKGKSLRNAQAAQEKQEQSHNKAMDAKRKEQTESLKSALKDREQVMRDHNDALKDFATDQKAVAEEIKGLLSEILGGGVDDDAIERFDVLSKLADVRGDFSGGDFSSVIEGAREGLELLKEYKEQSGASREDVLLLAEGFRSLFESASDAEGDRLKDAADDGISGYRKLKKELEENPIKAKVEPEEGAGKKLREQVQSSIESEPPVIIPISLAINGLPNGEIGLSTSEAADVLERESDKGGFRL